MTFARVQPAGWALNQQLKSSEMNALDVDHAAALDGNAGGAYAPSAKLDIQGLGLSAGRFYTNARVITGAYTLDATGPDVLLLANASAANVTVTLPAAVANRNVRVKLQTGPNIVHVAPNGADTIEGINATYNLTQVGSQVTLVGITGGWIIADRGANRASTTFTATTPSGFTVPAGCYALDLEACGGGGGGAGGTTGSTATSSYAGGGGGGGGAPFIRRRVAVTPGQVLDINIGAGGGGGATANAGIDGHLRVRIEDTACFLAVAPQEGVELG